MQPHQGTRARTSHKEIERVFAVSKVRLDSDGHITRVLWAEVNAASNLGVSTDVVASLSEVIDALHAGHRVLAQFAAAQLNLPERAFEVIEHGDGRETLALAGPHTPDREVPDIARLYR
jgi:hypothetical protein